MRNAVCVCVDGNMVVPGLFVLEAARTRRAAIADYDLILVTTGPADVTEAHRNWLSERRIQLRDDFDLSSLQNIDIREGRLTKATLLKLLLAEAFADHYDKILYLDADLTIHDDLAPIFSLDTKDFPLAAVPSARVETDWNRRQRQTEHAHFRALGMTEPFRYVNAGVLLIDVSHWNSDELTARTLDFLRRNPTLWRLPDEDALNAVLDGRLTELSPVWNLQAPMWANREVREMVEPVIIHYVGHNKPWRRYRRKMRLMEHRAAYRLYREFVRETPWSAWLSEQWSLRDLRDSLVYERRQLARQIKGRGAADAERRTHMNAYRQYCAQAVFADVEQGIVRRDGGRLRLNKSSGRSRDDP